MIKPEIITVEQSATINQILARHFSASGAILLIPVNDEDHYAHANMMGINPAKRSFVVNVREPDMRARLLRAPRIRVQAVIDNLLTWFYVDEFRLVQRGSRKLLELGYPKVMERAQRRAALRVDLPLDMPGTIVFALPESRKVVSARMVDVSATGCALSIAPEDDPKLDVGVAIKASRLRIGDDLDLRLRFYVRSRRRDRDGRILYGVEFDQLPEREERRVFNLVYKIQRRTAVL